MSCIICLWLKYKDLASIRQVIYLIAVIHKINISWRLFLFVNVVSLRMEAFYLLFELQE